MTDLTTTQDAPIATMGPAQLIALAIKSGADVDRLGKLMDLQERHDATQARKAYLEAIADFQATCPPIPRNKKVYNKAAAGVEPTVRYSYASLDQILSTVREPLRACGLAVRWSQTETSESITVTCHLTHMLGHEERSPMDIPHVSGHGTNFAQDRGSANSYGRRYTLINALGIQAEDDDDGQAAAPQHTTVLLKHNDALRDNLPLILCCKENLQQGGDISAAAEAYAELEPGEVAALWVAPSKGGIWTTDERRRIKSDEEFQAMVHQRREDSDWYTRQGNVSAT